MFRFLKNVGWLLLILILLVLAAIPLGLFWLSGEIVTFAANLLIKIANQVKDSENE